jgi:uroporphyrinogen-III synthase
MPTLNGLRVALLESRRSSELAELVRRFGGVPHAVPAVREVPRLEQVPAFLDRLCAGQFSMVICLTGAGISRLLDEAQRLGRLPETEEALRNAMTVCRGPKPAAVLRQHDIPVDVRAAEPQTTTELLDALATTDLAGRSLVVLHYGERNQALSEALLDRGAALQELCLYEWKLPEDLEPLKMLVRELIEGRVDAMTVTSQIQARHLFEIADSLDLTAPLIDALNERVIVAAIGPICVSALNAKGVTPQVVPPHAKMGFLVTALAEFLRVHRDQ